MYRQVDFCIIEPDTVLSEAELMELAEGPPPVTDRRPKAVAQMSDALTLLDEALEGQVRQRPSMPKMYLLSMP